jgi:pimeloyl-ACP methyl ester carboxylesterase
MFWNLKESSVKIGRGNIDYAVFGKGSRPMVIIPGLTLRDVKGAGAGLAFSFRKFAKCYRVYVFDKVNEVPEGYTVKDMATDTAEAMRSLGIKDACVYGVSLGGMVAQYLAIDHPDLVEKLALGVTLSRSNKTVEGAIERWVAFAESDNFGGIVKDMMKVMYSERYVKRYGWLFPLLSKLAVPKNKERFIRLAKSCLTCDTYDMLDKIQCPVLVIGGRQDKIVSGEASEEIAEKLGCSLYMYEDLGHAAYTEAKDFNRRVFDFLQE